MIEAKQVRYSVRGREILRGVDFRVEEGEFVGLIGPNGSGKSTFLKNLYKVLRPRSGELVLMGENLLAMSNREMARRMAVMVQEQEAAFDFTVEEVVMMGRQARRRLLETDSREDRELVDRILAATQLTALREQGFSTLSGGEKQRVLIARAIWTSSTSSSSWSWCAAAAAPWWPPSTISIWRPPTATGSTP